MDATTASLVQLLRMGVMDSDDEIVHRIKHLEDVNAKFEGTPLVFLYLEGFTRCPSIAIIKAFIEAGVDWNVRHNGNTCLHWMVVAPLGWIYGPTGILNTMLTSGADPKMTNSSGDNVLAAAIKHGHDDAVILLLAKAFPEDNLIEMDVISLIIDHCPHLPLVTLKYLTTTLDINYNLGHLEALFSYQPRRSNTWTLTKRILERLAFFRKSVREVARRRPQLLIDVMKMLIQEKLDYGTIISELSSTFKLNINYWSEEHGSVLSHLSGHRDREIENSSKADQIIYAMKMRVDDLILLPIVKKFNYELLNEMDVLNRIFENYSRVIDNQVINSLRLTVHFPVTTIVDLINDPYIKVNCDHLETFLQLKSWKITDSILMRLASNRESVREVKRRRPQLLTDVKNILRDVDALDYGPTIISLTKAFDLDINQSFDDSGTPLILVYFNDFKIIDLNILKQFVDLSINWNVVDSKGRAPLNYFVTGVNLVVNGTLEEAVRLLIGSGARLDLTDNQGNNVLHLAMSSSLVIVRTLLLGHPNPKQLINARNGDSESCLSLVLKRLSDEWQSMMTTLISYGADVHDVDSDHNNLLHLAFDSNCDLEAAKQVVNVMSTFDMNIAINKKNTSNHVPFYYAIKVVVDFQVLVKLIPSRKVLMDNENWDDIPVVEYVLSSKNSDAKNEGLVRLLQELLHRGAIRSSSSTLRSFIANRAVTLELFELAILYLEMRTSFQDLDLAIELERVEFFLTILRTASRDFVQNLKFCSPDIINRILKVLIANDSEQDLHSIMKVLVDEFRIDINCVTDEHGFVVHNLIRLVNKKKTGEYKKVFDYVLEFDNLDIDQKVDSMSGLDEALSNCDYATGAKLVQKFASVDHLNPFTISKVRFTRFAKLLFLIKSDFDLQFSTPVQTTNEYNRFQNWIAERKRTVHRLTEMCALQVGRSRTKLELMKLIADKEFPEETKDIFYLSKDF